jgi:D-cysteine desulfhydrase
MIDLIRTGFFKTNETILFLHTGGQPALFAEQYADEFNESRIWGGKKS